MTQQVSDITQTEEALTPGQSIHLIGIGGSGMSAIARVLVGRGFYVTGSDMNESEFTVSLRQLGAHVHIGHSATYIGDADIVVRSSAIPDRNPEVVAARQAGIPVLKRAQFLGRLMTGSSGIAIAGTHGKTTTTSMIAKILLDAGLDPTVIVGGVIPSLGTNAHAGQGDYFVIEADEYDNMFLGLSFDIAVVNNLEHDHPDIFESDEAYRAAFRAFAMRLPSYGRLIVNADDDARTLISADDVPFELLPIGLGANARLRAVDIQTNSIGGSDFVVLDNEKLVGIVRLRVPGEHNVRNALAAIAVTLDLNIKFEQIRSSLAAFGGVGRRFQRIGDIGGVAIIDDYGHHPTEIKVTLAAARQQFPGRTLWAVWQPHTYSRTKLLFDEFANAFGDADRVIALDIYRSREKDTLGVDSGMVVAAMPHRNARHIGAIEDAADWILDRISRDAVVLTLGAGDGNRVGQLVYQGLQDRS